MPAAVPEELREAIETFVAKVTNNPLLGKNKRDETEEITKGIGYNIPGE